MEADGFIYDSVGFEHEYNIEDYNMFGKKSQTPKSNRITPRKFGTDITRSVKGNSSKRRSSASVNRKKREDLKDTSDRNQSQEQRDRVTFLSPTRGIASRFHPTQGPSNSTTTNRSSFEKDLAQQTSTTFSHRKNSGQPSSSGKKVLVVKSTHKTKFNPIFNDDNDVVRSKENEQSSFKLVPQTPSTTRKSVEYTIHFNPGPIGLKLEPVVKSVDREIGCRVMKFVEPSRSSPTGRTSQAKKSGKINIGDILVMINDTNIMSRSYSEIVEILKASVSSANGRSITFRSVRDTNSPKSTSKQFSINTIKENQSFSPVEFVNNPISVPSAVAITSSVLVDRPKYSYTENENLNTNNISPIIENQVMTPTSKSENESVQTPKENLTRLFSPSSVKKITQSNNKKNKPSSLITPQRQFETTPFVDVLQTVMKSVAPTAVESLRNTSSTVTNAVTKISEVLTGSASNKFSEAMQLKMVLLQELSEAKAALGESEDTKKHLQQELELLANKNRQAQKDKTNSEIALKIAQDRNAAAEMSMKDRESKLKIDSIRQAEDLSRAQQKVAETMAVADRRFEENELLKAKMEEATINFEAREEKLQNQLSRNRVELEDRNKRLQKLQTHVMNLESQIEDKDSKVLTVSHELMERTMKLDRLMSIVEEKDLFFRQKDASLKETQNKLNSLEEAYSALRKKNEEEVLKNVENDAIIRRLTRDMETKTEEKNNSISTIQKKDEELKLLMGRHENTTSKLNDDNERLNKELNDLKHSLSSSNDNLGKIEFKLQQAMKSEETLMKENACLREENQKCNIKTQEITKEVETCKSALSESQNETECLLLKQKSLQEEIQVLNEKCSRKQTEAESSRKQWEEEKNELEKKLGDTILKLEEKSESIKEKEISFNEKIQLLRESFAEKEKSSVDAIEKQALEVINLQRELETYRASNEELKLDQTKKESSLSSEIEELTKQLDIKSKENQKIIEDLSGKTLDCSELKMKLQNVLVSKNELEAALSKERIKVSEYIAQEKEITKYRTEVNTCKKEINLIQKERDNFENMTKLAKKDLMEQRAEWTQKSLNASENEKRQNADIERLNGIVESLTKEKCQLSQVVESLNKKADTIVGLEKDKEQLAKNLSESITKFEDLQSELTKNLTSSVKKENQIADLMTQIQSLEKDKVMLIEDYKKLSTEKKSLEEKSEILRNQFDLSKTQLLDLQAEKQLSDELAEKMSIREDAAISNIKTLSKKLESTGKQLEESRSENLEIKTQLSNTTQELKMLKDLNVGLEEKIISVETIHAQDIIRANDLKECGFQMKEAFEKESNALKLELNKYKQLLSEKVKSSQKIMKQKDNTINDLTTIIENMTKQAEENFIAFNKLETDLKKKVASETDLLEKNQEKNADLIALSDRFNDLEQKFSSTSKSKSDLQKTLENKMAEIQSLNTCCDEKDKFATDVSEKLRVANNKVANLQDEVACLLASKDAEAKCLNELVEVSKRSLADENELIQKERKQISEKIKDTMSNIEEKQLLITQQEKLLKRKDEEIKSLTNKNENEIKKMHQKLDGMEQEVIDSERRVYEVLSMLDDRERIIEVLEREMEENLEQFHFQMNNEGKYIESCNEQVKTLKEEIAVIQKSRNDKLIEMEGLKSELEETKCNFENEVIRSTKLETSLKENQVKLQKNISIMEERNNDFQAIKQQILDLGNSIDLSFPVMDDLIELQNILMICDKIKTRMKEYQSNTDKALKLATNRQHAIARLERMLSSKEKEVKDSRKQANDKLKKVSELMLLREEERANTCEMEIECKVLNATNHENNSKLVDHQLSIKHLDSEIKNLQGRLSEYIEREQLLQEELDDTNDQLFESQKDKENCLIKIKELELKCVLFKEAADNSYENADTYRKLTLDQKHKLENVTSDLEQMNQRNSQLETKVSDLTLSESAFIKKFENESSTVANLGKEMKEKNKIIESLMSRIKSLRENVDKNDDEKLNIQTKLDLLQAETRDEIRGLKNIAENRSYVIKSLKNEVIKKSSEINSLKNMISDKNDAYDDQIEENQQLLETIEQLEKQVSDLKESLDEEVKLLKKELAAKDSALQELESTSNNYRDENQSLKEKIVKGREENETLLRKNSNGKKLLESYEDKIKVHLDKIDSTETALEEKCAVIREQDRKIKDLNMLIAQSDESKSTLQEKLNYFENVTRETESAANEAINLVEEKEKELLKIKSKLEEKNNDLERSEASNMESKNLLSEYEKDYGRLENTLREKTSEVHSLLNKISSLQSDFKSVERNHDIECKKLKEETMKLKTMSKSQEKECEEAKIKIAYLGEEIKRLNDDLCKSNASNSKLTKLSKELNLQIEQMQSRNRHEVNENASKISEVEAKNQILQEKINDLMQQRHHSEKQMEEVKSKNQILSRNYDDKAAEVIALNHKMDECREYVEKNVLQLEELTQKQNEQEQLIENLKEKESELVEKSICLDKIKESICKLSFEDQSNGESFNFEQSPIEDSVEMLLKLCKKRATCDTNENTKVQGKNQAFVSPKNSHIDDGINSPTLAVVSKHSLLLEELKNMKAAINTAITPVKVSSVSPQQKSDCDDVDYLDELNSKNQVLLSLKERIDALVIELTATKQDLNFKEGCLEDLSRSIRDLEMERIETNSKVDSMTKYIDQMEDSLTNEIKRKRQLEKDYQILRSEAKALAVQYKLKANELIEIRKELDLNKNQSRSSVLPKDTDKELKNAASRLLFQTLESRQRNAVSNAFHHWVCVTSRSQAVSRQMDLTQKMASQLELTRENLFTLKSRLRNGGMLNMQDDNSSDENLRSQENQKVNEVPSSSVNNSSFWDISDGEISEESNSSCE